jgi:hypothetical protein
MSRSRRKNPFRGLGGNSEKWDKRKNNRRLRRKCQQAIRDGKDILPLMREVSDQWLMNKDGKVRLDPDNVEDMQK